MWLGSRSAERRTVCSELPCMRGRSKELWHKHLHLPLSQQLVPGESALEDAHHLLPSLGLAHQVCLAGLVQQLHEGLWGRRIHYG